MTGKVVFCKVNQFTRADEVANAMDSYRQELGSEVKVKGHKLPGGEIELYWSTKRSTLWERLTGKAAERRRLARIAFKQVQKNEHWALEKDVCFIHEHHKEAFSTLLSSVGFIKAGKGHRLMEKWNGKAMRSKSLFVQLTTLDRLCRAVRREHADRYKSAIDWYDGLSTLPEGSNGVPEIPNLSYKKQLGEGGYGAVHLYKSDGGQKFAAKIVTPAIDGKKENGMASKAFAAEAKRDFMHECQSLARATGSRSNQIVRFEHAFRTDMGRLVLLMEYAPYGSLADFAEIISQAKGLDPGHVFKVKAMLLRDIFQGVLAAHKAGVIHGDLKPENIVIGDGGVAKITDFGTAQIGPRLAPSLSPPVDNPRSLAPEVVEIQQALRENDDLRSRPELADDIQRFFPENLNLKPEAAEVVVRGLTSNKIYEEKARLAVGPESDLWALGAIAFNLAYGKGLIDETEQRLFDTEIRQQLLGFGKDRVAVGNTDEDGSFEPGYFMAGDGGEFGGTINLLLRRNQEDRVSLEDLLQQWPSEEALGGPSTRTLIERLASGKWNPDDEDGTESVASDDDSGALRIPDSPPGDLSNQSEPSLSRL